MDDATRSIWKPSPFEFGMLAAILVPHPVSCGGLQTSGGCDGRLLEVA